MANIEKLYSFHDSKQNHQNKAMGAMTDYYTIIMKIEVHNNN